MRELERTHTLTAREIALRLASVVVISGIIAALLFWLGGTFIIGAILVAVFGPPFLWRVSVQMRGLRRGDW